MRPHAGDPGRPSGVVLPLSAASSISDRNPAGWLDSLLSALTHKAGMQLPAVKLRNTPGRSRDQLSQRSWPRWFETASNWYFYGVLAVYLLAVLLSHHAPSLQDYPIWVYEGVALSHAIAGHPDAQFTIKRFTVPNVLSDVGLGVLSSVFPWQIAAKLWIGLYLVVSAFTYKYFFQKARLPIAQANWVAPTLSIVNLCFWWGFINFQFGLTLMVLFCALLFRERVQGVAIAILLSIVFLSHAIPFAVCSIVLMLYILSRRTYALLLAYLPVCLMGMWYLYGRFILTGNRDSTQLSDPHIPYLSGSFLLYKINGVLKSFGYVRPQVNRQLWSPLPHMAALHWFLFAVVALVGAGFLYLAAVSCLLAFRAASPERFLWIASIVTFLAGLACPSEALGISDPGSRFLACSMVLALLCSRAFLPVSYVVCWGSVLFGISGALMFVNLSARPYDSATAPPSASHSRHFAHVNPESHTLYYDALEQGSMRLPVFDTAVFLNRTVPAAPAR